MSLRRIESLGPLSGKRVIVRCDLNVPLSDGTIADDGRIRASIPTLTRLVSSGARVIILSHLGRPHGTPSATLSLASVANRVSELLGTSVNFVPDTIGTSAKKSVSSLRDGDVLVLENLRFNEAETSGVAEERQVFAQKLAQFGDVVVSDGFGVLHRKEASVYELPRLLPSAAGELIASELEVLTRLVDDPPPPYTVVLGGAKVSDKLDVIGHLLPRVTNVLIGGGMLFTFLAARGFNVGSSLLESDQIETVRGFLTQAEFLGINLDVPSDIVVADSLDDNARSVVTAADSIEDTPFGADGIGVDIGPETSSRFAKTIAAAQTAFWNGPMGVFEHPSFATGTRRIAQALTEVPGLSVVGGGDSAAAVRALGFADEQFGHVSTGGGASLEFLEGARLPGLEVLGWQ